jgi:quercetin dioxygenase-like cupin family protein
MARTDCEGRLMENLAQYLYFDNLPDLMDPISPDSITSRTLHKSKAFKVVLFAFDQGQSLSEHSASQTAVVQILRGEATLTIGQDIKEVEPGAWVQMPPHLKHSVYAKTPLVMLLLLISPHDND